MKFIDIISSSYMLTGSAFLMLTTAASMKIIRKVTDNVSRQLFADLFFIIFFTLGSLFVYMFVGNIQMPDHLSIVSAAAILAIFAVILYGHVRMTMKACRRENARQRNIEERLKLSFLIDPTTGMYNKQGFSTLIKHHLLLAKRDKCAVMFFTVTIRNLKKIAEKGHQESNLILCETAKLLKATFRKSDISGRVDDDTFMVLLVAAKEIHEEAITSNFEKKLDSHNKRRTASQKLLADYRAVPYDPLWNDELNNIIEHAKNHLLEKKNNWQPAAQAF